MPKRLGELEMLAHETLNYLFRKANSLVYALRHGDCIYIGGSSERNEREAMDESMLDFEAGESGQSYDPFARREGQSLTWKNVSMTLVRWSRCLPVVVVYTGTHILLVLDA
jgi:hypothetical protein